MVLPSASLPTQLIFERRNALPIKKNPDRPHHPLMKKLALLAMAAAFAPVTFAQTATPAASAAPAAMPSATPETKEHRDARMAWWREAKFGMFIHWGVYSVPAGYYHGKPVPGIGEWIMNRGKIPMAEYQQFAKQFNPVKFNADDWVKAAKNAGMKYIVITSKHHDGFAMFPSQGQQMEHLRRHAVWP